MSGYSCVRHKIRHETMLCPECNNVFDERESFRKMLNRLVNICNVVTANWRHGNAVSETMMSELYDRQLEAERMLGRLK